MTFNCNVFFGILYLYHKSPNIIRVVSLLVVINSVLCVLHLITAL